MKVLRALMVFTIMMIGISEMKAQAQYDKALGLRLGGSVGVTYVQPMWNNYMEFIGEFRFGNNGYFAVGALYEMKYSFFDIENMDWYFGGGANIGISDDNFGVGIDGVIGLEYTLDSAPLNIGIDWKPGFDLINSANYLSNGAISIRYVFN